MKKYFIFDDIAKGTWHYNRDERGFWNIRDIRHRKDKERDESIFDELRRFGAVLPQKEVKTKEAPADRILSDEFMLSKWKIEKGCAIVIENNKIGNDGIRIEVA